MQRVIADLGVVLSGLALWLLSASLGVEFVERLGMVDRDSGYIIIFLSGPVALMALVHVLSLGEARPATVLRLDCSNRARHRVVAARRAVVDLVICLVNRALRAIRRHC